MNLPKDASGLLSGSWLKWLLVAFINIALLYVITLMYAQGETAFAMVVLLIGSIGTWIFTHKKCYSFRYIYPSLLGVILFVVFPLIYTVNIAFTNYSSTNLLTLDRVKEIHLEKTYKSGIEKFGFKLLQTGDTYQLQLGSKSDSSRTFSTKSFSLSESAQTLNATPGEASGKKLNLKHIIKLRNSLKNISVELPEGSSLVMTSLREFGAMSPLYREGENGQLISNKGRFSSHT